MNKVVLGAVAVAVVAGAGIGATAWSGSKVTQELHDQTAATLALFPAIKVIEHRTDKGFFSSTHVVTLQVGCQPGADGDAAAGKPIQITWRDNIQHGPLPGGRHFGLAAITSELVLPTEVSTALAKYMGQQAPLQVRTVVGYTGNYTSEFSSPAFKYEEAGKGQLDWMGIKAVFSGNLRQGLAGGSRFSLDIPGMTLNVAKTENSEGGSFKLGRVESSGETIPHPQASIWLRPGKATGSIASAEFRVNDTKATGKPVTVLIDGIKFSSESTLDNGLFNASNQFSAKARVDDFAIDKIEMKASLRHLHAATYQKFLDRFFGASMSCDKNAQAALQESLMSDLQKDLSVLLQQNPEYALDQFAVEIGGKRAELSYKLGMRGVTTQDADAPAAMLAMTKGYAQADGSIHNGLIEQVVKRIAAMQTQASAAPVDAAASGASAPAGADNPAAAERAAAEQMMMMIANQFINEWASKGYVVRDGELIKASAKYEHGQLQVNGKPFMPGGAAPAADETEPAQQ